MDKKVVDTSFITGWVRKWDPSLPPELLSKVQEAYTAWYQEREPRHAFDDNNDLMRANNVVILGPTKDFKQRQVHLIVAENKTRGRLFSYSIDIGLPKFSRLSTLELGSFIGKPSLSDYEDFGSRESFPNRNYIRGLYYDKYALGFLTEALEDIGLNLRSKSRRHYDLLDELKRHVIKQSKNEQQKH